MSTLKDRKFDYMPQPRISPKKLRKVGSTYGLVLKCGAGKPEQVYVSIHSEDEERPVVVDGWVGYALDMRLQLTEEQAIGLAKLLIDATTRKKGRVNVNV